MKKANFNVTLEATFEEFNVAIHGVACEMMMSKLSDEIAKREAYLSSKKTISKVKADSIREEIAEAKASLEDYKAQFEGAKSIIERVKGAMVEASPKKTLVNGDEVAVFANAEARVNNVLRLLACVYEPSLNSYALPFGNYELMGINNAINNIVFASIDENNGAYTRTNGKLYTEAIELLNKLVKNELSIAWANPYTKKFYIECKGADVRALVNSWVTGYANKFKTDKETEVVTFESLNEKRLVNGKKTKKGIEYNYTKLNALLVTLLVSKFM